MKKSFILALTMLFALPMLANVDKLIVAAEKGDVDAQYQLGLCYHGGEYSRNTCFLAYDWFYKAAEQGHMGAQFYVGFGLLEECFPTVIMEVEHDSKVSAADWFRKAADQGHAEAQCYLGYFYYCGYGVEQDYSQAVYWFKKAADQGHAGGQFHLAMCYQLGHGVERNIQTSRQLSDLAAKGDAEEQYHIAFRFFHIEKNGVSAMYWYQLAAEHGSMKAQKILGTFYSLEEIRDVRRALFWFCQAANQGDVEVQCMLADCYVEGMEVEQDYSQAVYWYRLAAQRGERYAQYNLGVCYYNGYGVEQDYSQAAYWFQQAADKRYGYILQDSPETMDEGGILPPPPLPTFLMYGHFPNSSDHFDVGLSFFKGGEDRYYGFNVEQDYEQSARCFLIAAEGGNKQAQYCLGVCYQNGYGVPQNDERAAFWYRLSLLDNEEGRFLDAIDGRWIIKEAERGNAESQYWLASLFDRREPSKDDEYFVYWCRKAAEQGYRQAQYELGERFEKGKGVQQDYSQAAYWYRLAAEQGHAYAQIQLGVFYECGIGVPQDDEQSQYWFDLAAKQGFRRQPDAIWDPCVYYEDFIDLGEFDENEEIELIIAEPVEYEDDEDDEEQIFLIVEKMPEFPGGIEALFKFIAENINLPAEIVCDQCRTICQFVVEKDGSISNVQVVRSSGDDFLDKAAVRVLSIMPKWKPGEQQGKLIRTTYTIPINWIPASSPQ